MAVVFPIPIPPLAIGLQILFQLIHMQKFLRKFASPEFGLQLIDFTKVAAVSQVVFAIKFFMTLVTNLSRQFLPVWDILLVFQLQIFQIIFSTVLFVQLMVSLPQVRGTLRQRTPLGISRIFRESAKAFLCDEVRKGSRMQLNFSWFTFWPNSFSYMFKRLQMWWISSWFAFVNMMVSSTNMRCEMGGAFFAT